MTDGRRLIRALALLIDGRLRVAGEGYRRRAVALLKSQTDANTVRRSEIEELIRFGYLTSTGGLTPLGREAVDDLLWKAEKHK